MGDCVPCACLSPLVSNTPTGAAPQLVRVMASAPTGGTVCNGAWARPIAYLGRLQVGNVTNVEL